ncbi:phage terminase large subunit GpA-like protein [Methylorubrum extorquens]
MSVRDRVARPREALERDPDGFLAEGLANFRAGARDLRAILEVPEDLDVVEWTEEHFYLSPETFGTRQKVRWTGYQKGFLRMCQDPEIDVLVNPKSARTGMTQALMGDGAYEIGHKRNQCMNVQPSDLKAQEFSNDYLQPAFRDSPKLSPLVRKPKKGERQNTWCDIQYANGGSMRLGWASSDDTFRGRTAGKMYADEVDADSWEPTAASQGDKLALFLDRGETRAGSKLVIISSPTRKKGSRIWPLWEKSDQRRYFVPCPDCGHMQYLRWGTKDSRYGIKPLYGDDGNFTEAVYMCEECEYLIPDDKVVREAMDAAGEYRATAVSQQRGLVGVHVSALYSLMPKSSWTKLWELWTAAQGDPQKLKTFVNTKLGEPWEDVVIKRRPNATVIATERPRPYRAEVPGWARYLTMAVDTQEGHHDPDRKDYRPPRHELAVKAWGPQEESALVYYAVIPATTPFDQAAQAALDEVLFRKWKREDGKLMTVLVNAVDCGYMMDEAITYCQGTKRAAFCRPVHGQRETTVELAPVIISKPGVHQQSGRQFVLLGTRQAKNIIDRRLHEVSEPGPGYMHIPSSLGDAMPVGYDYFEGLMAERPEKDLKGVLHWERISKANTGEPWDLEVYNLAAIRLAKAQYTPVKSFMNAQKLREVEAPYDGEDRSAMAEVLSRKLLLAGTGGETGLVDDVEGYAPAFVPQLKAPPKVRQLAVSRSSFSRR